jgi:hypothetical protein
LLSQCGCLGVGPLAASLCRENRFVALPVALRANSRVALERLP